MADAATASAPVVVETSVALAPAPVVAAYNTPVIAPQVSYSYLPYVTNYSYNVPVVAVDKPVSSDQINPVDQPVETKPVETVAPQA